MTLAGIAILTIIEYLALMLLVCKAVLQSFTAYIKPISIYAPIYVLILLTRAYIPDYIALIAMYVSLVVFIKTIFNKKLGISMFICLSTMFLSIAVLQTLSTIALGMYLSEAVEFTFRNGLIAMSLTLIFAHLCYLFLPLNKLVQWLNSSNRYLYFIVIFFTAILAMFLLSNFSYFEALYTRRALIDIFLYAGISFLITACFYSIMNIVLELKHKTEALKKFEHFRNLSTNQNVKIYDYEEHLQIIRWLSFIYTTNKDKLVWYIETYLDNFEDDEENEVGYDSKSRLWKLDNKVLSAYLYVKTKRLRELGVTCEIAISNYIITSKIKTSKLIEAIDILVDEALETSTKERSDLTIVLREDRNRDGRSCVDVTNRNDLIPGQDTMRMVFEEYSLKTKQVRGLRKLNKISVEYDCFLSLRNERSFDDEYYLRLRYLL